jgi:iron-sulfur cluster assembly accessory protein
VGRRYDWQDMVTQIAPVDVTDRAAEKALQLGVKEGHGEDVCLRLRVLAGGCSGFSYQLTFEDGPADDDLVTEHAGLRVLVDPASAPIVAGSTIEFVDAMLGGGFKVNNPQAVSECSCGESFSV